MTRAHPEYELQCAVADLLNAILDPSVLWTSIDHSYRGKMRGGMLKRAGVRAGIPDIMICWRSHRSVPPNARQTLWIELKSKKGIMSPAQIQFCGDAREVGHWYRTVRNVDEVEQLLGYFDVPTRGKIAA